MTALYYTASGPVRGDCGHRHRTPEAAGACLGRDARACASLPGGRSYSDREVRRSDGEYMTEEDGRWMTVAEAAQVE